MVRTTTASVCILAAALGCQPNEAKPTSLEGADQAKDANAMAKLNVQVFYRERIMLPPTSTLRVVLEDGAKMDVAAVQVTEVEVPVETGPPYNVTLEYDPSTLDPKGRYGVRARIENEGRLEFTSTSFNSAFGTHGSSADPANDPVEVLLQRVPAARAPSGISITGTQWVLETLRGKPAGLGAGGRAPNITLQGSEPRVSGFTGCNQISGGYTLEGNMLSFGQMAMTMRACPDGMELERDFAKALSETKSYQIEGDTLSLKDEAGTVVAVLKEG
jgi:putative lipoprotein